MFVFFSISLGKRAVYLLPLYPALAVLTAAWVIDYKVVTGVKAYYYRAVALFAVFTGTVLLLVVVGQLWNHNPALLFSPVEPFLKPKDRANFTFVIGEIAAFGWPFAVTALLSALLWFSLARCLWSQKILAAALQLILLVVVFSFIPRALIVPKLAEAKSYRPFMLRVNELVGANDKLYLYRNSFNSDQVVFYRGEPIETLDSASRKVSASGSETEVYVIMTEREWLQLRKLNATLPAPLLKTNATGPEENAPLVLLKLRMEDRG
jgi:hypothetical protein